MASICTIGTEIILMILRYVDDECPKTIKQSVVLVSKQFKATAQLVAHRRTVITYNPVTLGKTQEQIQTWLEDDHVLRNIRQLALTGFVAQNNALPGGPKPEQEDLTPIWAPLVELVTKAARLTRVDFSLEWAEFPLALLEALQTYHPNVKLYVWNISRGKGLDHTDAAEQALAISPILRGIKSVAWNYGSGAPIDLRVAAFQRIVANAPNLEFASFTKGYSGCVMRSQGTLDRLMEQRAAAKFFLDLRGPNTSLRRLTLDGFNFNKATLEEWGKYVSLPHLEDLKCSRGFPDSSYFEIAPSLLTNLKHLSLNLSTASRRPEIPPLVEGYLTTCAPLETLSLWSWMGVVTIDTILKHGSSLKRLELHERESTDLGSRRGSLSVEDVRRIRKECPQLGRLSLDMDREDADWRKDIDLHKEMLHEISQFGRRLQGVQIYLDLGVANKIAGVNRPATSLSAPHTDGEGKGGKADGDAPQSSAEYVYRGPFKPISRTEMHKHGEQVWKIIFGHHNFTSPRELDIKWGEWERKLGMGHPASWVFWEQQNKRHVSVRPEVRDDRHGEATVHIEGGHGREGYEDGEDDEGDEDDDDEEDDQEDGGDEDDE